MVRTYKPKNRYCRNTKLDEDEFKQVATAFFAGLGAAATARNMARSERSIRDMFARLRERLMSDAALTGWMGGGDQLPDADDPIWRAIYDCLGYCPAYVDDRVYSSPEYVSDFRGYRLGDENSQETLTFVRKKHGSKCTRCPIALKFDFDISVREEWGRHELRMGGIPRDNFKPHYFEIMFRTNTRIQNSKFGEASKYLTLDAVFKRLEQEPL